MSVIITVQNGTAEAVHNSGKTLWTVETDADSIDIANRIQDCF